MRVTSARALPVLIALSVGLSGLILAQTGDVSGRKAGTVFQAEDPPAAVAGLLHAAGLSLAEETESHDPLAAMEAKAIRGKDGKLLTLKGIGFLPAIQLEGRENKYKAQSAPLEPGKAMSMKRGAVFPMLGLQAMEDQLLLPAVRIKAKGDTKLFMETAPGKYEKLTATEIEGDNITKKKAKTPPFSSPFALAGKKNKLDQVGMFKLPVLEYRKFAKRLQEAKMDRRGGKIMKTVPGSLTKMMDERDPGELYVDHTRLKKFQLKVGVRGGEAAKFEIRKMPAPR